MFLYLEMAVKSLVEISIDGFFNQCNNGEKAPFCYFTHLHYWMNVREIAFLCDCELICKNNERYCCFNYSKVLSHCPTCILKKCKHCRRLEKFNTLYSHVALNRTFKFRKYLLDLWHHITKYERYYITDPILQSYICRHTSLYSESDEIRKNEDSFFYKTAKKLDTNDLKKFLCCEKLKLTTQNLLKIYGYMFSVEEVKFRNFHVYNKVNHKNIRIFLSSLCKIWRMTDSITVLDYFMYILPFPRYNLNFLINFRWTLL